METHGRHLALTLYTIKDDVHLLADLKTPASDEQIESKELKIIEFENANT